MPNYDYTAVNNDIHILDLDLGNKSVTNAIEDIQFEINYLLSYSDKRTWFLYGSDGLVCIFNNGTFTHVKDDDPRLLPQYISIMKERKKEWEK